MNLIKDFLGYVLFIVLLPVIILAVIVRTVLTAFEGKSKDGKSKKIDPSCEFDDGNCRAGPSQAPGPA